MHESSSEFLAPEQQLVIDVADLVQDLAKATVVGQGLGGVAVVVLRNVIHLRAPLVMTDGEVVLGAMASATGAFAARLATGYVALDEGTTEQTIEWRYLAQQLAASSAQSRRRLFAQRSAHICQYTYITVLPTRFVKWNFSFVNPLLLTLVVRARQVVDNFH